MRNFNPKTTQDNKRSITRVQEGFGAGMFDDIPAHKIPVNGVKYSTNYHLHGDRGEPRGGNRLWGDWENSTAHAALPSLPGRTGYSLTKSGTTVTKTVGTSFTAADVGNYIVYDDGVRERIDAYISATQVTMAVSTAHAASTAAYVMGPVNCIKFHKRTGKVVMHIDTRIFISSDRYISSWVECYNVTPEYSLDSSISFWDEKDIYAYFYNADGIFRLDLSDLTDLSGNPPLYFKINTPTPSVAITDTARVDLGYARKYVYQMIRLSGTGDRDRNTSGVTIEQISGPTAVNDDFKDYGKVWNEHPFGPDDVPTSQPVPMGTLTVPTNPSTGNIVGHWTHYALYATLDAGEDYGKTNNPELFVWLGDIPVVTPLICGRSGNVVTATSGTFSLNDVGCTITWQDGTTAVISIYNSPTSVNVYTTGTVTAQAANLGEARAMTASQTTTTITRTSGGVFSSNDVGKQVFWLDGRKSVITAYTDANTVTAYPSQTVTSTAAAIDPSERDYNDDTLDATLQDRIGGYSLQNRFFQPLPDCNMGVIVGAFMYVAVRDQNRVYYSQIPDSEIYRAGYYNADYQVVLFKDIVRLIREYPDRLVIFCAGSTHAVPTNVFDEEEVPEIGEVVAVVSGKFTVDHGIGLLDHGSVQQITHGRERMITNEFAVREFDGKAYSKIDYSYGRLRKKLMKLENSTASGYNRETGYLVWGLEE